MRRRSVLVLTALLAALCALGLVVLRKVRGADPKGSALSLAAPALGREAVLHVRWRETSTARLPEGEAGEGRDGTITGALDLEADLVLAGERTTDDLDAIRAELRDVRTSRVVVSGTELLQSGEAAMKSLENQPIHLVVEDGRITRVLVDKNSSSLTVQLVENAARQVLLERPVSATTPFEREERSSAGVFRMRYEPRGAAFDRTVLGAVSVEGLPETCTGACVIAARGESNVTFKDGDAVASLVDKREIHAGFPGRPASLDSTSSFEAQRTGGTDVALASVDAAALTSKLPGEVYESEAEHHAALLRLAEGASIDDVLGGVSTMAAAGPSSLAKGWLVRSSALLELHPELLSEVAIHFEDEALGSSGRVAILDLLAATGGEAAQAALLKTLDTAAARQGESRLDYVQRLVLVEQPSAATARQVRDRLAQSQASGDTEMAYAEAHVLGALAGRLEARGIHGEGKAATNALAEALDRSKAPGARAAYLSALGNAGDGAQVPRIAKHARDEDPAVRRAAASALRKTKTPESHAALVTLARDQDEEVQVTALASLAQQPATPGEQRELAQLLDTPQLGGEAEQQLTTLLLRQGPPSPEVRSSLEHLLARTGDPRLAARVRFAIEASGQVN
ncbi:MAG: hypothetical protein JWP97_3482 [Labilithrix sp.]|nr:hypothetical protein [Labilithrix sp.]